MDLVSSHRPDTIAFCAASPDHDSVGESTPMDLCKANACGEDRPWSPQESTAPPWSPQQSTAPPWSPQTDDERIQLHALNETEWVRAQLDLDVDVFSTARDPRISCKPDLEALGLETFLRTKVSLMESLTCLTLSENHIGDDGARILRDVLTSSEHCVRRLVLMHVGIGASGMMEIGQLVCDCPALTTVTLGGVTLADCAGDVKTPLNFFWDCVLRSPWLREIRLSHSGITSAMLPQFCSALQNENLRLEVLNLSYNRLTGEGMLALGMSLGQNAFLKALELSNNKMGPSGAEALVTGLSKAAKCALERLRVDCNYLEDRGCRAFARLWLQNSCGIQLRLLDMRGNRLSDPAVEDLCRMLGKPVSEKLEFGQRQVLIPGRLSSRGKMDGSIVHRTYPKRYEREDRKALQCSGRYNVFGKW